jgi:hypothetical protein
MQKIKDKVYDENNFDELERIIEKEGKEVKESDDNIKGLIYICKKYMHQIEQNERAKRGKS